jgi:multidrug resistance efflux pump
MWNSEPMEQEKSGQNAQAAPSEKPTANRINRKNGIRKIVLLVVLPALVLAGLGYYLWARTRVTTDDAYLEGRIHTIAPRVAGYVVKVLVEDNQEVKKGQVLLTLDPTDYEVGLASARAALAEARATLTSLELGVPLELNQTSQRVRGAKAELAANQKNLAAAQQEVKAASEEIKRAQSLKELAALELKRVRSLRTRNAMAQASLDQARTTYETAMAAERAARERMKAAGSKRDALQADLERVKAGIDLASTGQDLATIKSRQVEAQKARVKLAQAKVRQAELNLGLHQGQGPGSGPDHQEERGSRQNGLPGSAGDGRGSPGPGGFVGDRQLQGDPAHRGAPRNAGDPGGGRLPRSGTLRQGGVHHGRHRRGLFPVPAGKRHGQLREGGAAHPCKDRAGPAGRRQPAGFAYRNERGAHHTFGPVSRLARPPG